MLGRYWSPSWMLTIELVDLMTGSFSWAFAETANTAKKSVITNFMCLADHGPAPRRFPIPRSRHRERIGYDTEDLNAEVHIVTRIYNHCPPVTSRRIIIGHHTNGRGRAMEKHRLARIEQYILEFFQQRQLTRIMAKDLFDSTPEYANADLVRALEDLEKKQRLLVRHTYDG